MAVLAKMLWLLQEIAGRDVIDQFETIMSKHKLNPVSNNPTKLFQARKRAKRALKSAVGALQGEWDTSQIIHVRICPHLSPYQARPHTAGYSKRTAGIWELTLELCLQHWTRLLHI